MAGDIELSIIIPVWRGALPFLPKLLETIPQNEDIEVIVVDNSKEPLVREEINSLRKIVLMHSDTNRHAGGSRNAGVCAAKGKWIVFADADDYFTREAFDTFYSMLSSDSDVIYTCAQGIYIDTGERSDRGDVYSKLIRDFLTGKKQEIELRTGISVPWCKMIKKSLIEKYNIRFDEIVAGNDIYFSLLVGYYAKKITAIDVVTYIVTVSKGTLTKRADYEAIRARLYSKLHCNQFLKAHGLSNKQHSVMFALARVRHYSFSQTLELIKMIIKFKQNPLIGMSNWMNTLMRRTQDKEYYTS